MKTGIMGGTFNPIHNAHLLIAQMAMEEYGLDRVIFMTSGNPPHKNDTMSAQHRLNMTRIAIEGNGDFEDDDFEVNRTEKSYTLHTLEYLKSKYPEDKLFFIIGEDSLEDLPKWYRPNKILDLCTLLVFPRKSQKSLSKMIEGVPAEYRKRILPIHAPVMGFSSTEIRKRITDGKTVRYMIPDGVLEYIKSNHLYEE
jgi:nicotinate-nucleotide adenylyltransferase